MATKKGTGKRRDSDFHKAADKMDREAKERAKGKVRDAFRKAGLRGGDDEAAPLTYELLSRDDDSSVFEVMDELIEKHHEHLDAKRVALAWHYGLKPDADGRIVLGRCKKASDLDRELHDYDFVIILNHEVWRDRDPRTSGARLVTITETGEHFTTYRSRWSKTVAGGGTVGTERTSQSRTARFVRAFELLQPVAERA